MTVNPAMNVNVGDNDITVTRPNDLAANRSAHGLTRTLIANMVDGVSSGFSKHLEIIGVGFRAGDERDNLAIEPWIFARYHVLLSGRDSDFCSRANEDPSEWK